MPTSTYTALANITLGTSATTVTFTSIAAGYRDLVLVMNGKSSTGSIYPALQFNGDSGSNYSIVDMFGDGSSASSGNATGLAQLHMLYNSSWDTGNLGVIVANIMDFSATDKHKTVISRSSKADTTAYALTGRWANTSAITSIAVISYLNSFASGSTFALYGIAA